MLAKLFKAFVGDKSANDIKEVQPVVDRVKEAEKSLGNLSADDLRAVPPTCVNASGNTWRRN